jgi:ADP-heptose:LPS heptosyltransferase
MITELKKISLNTFFLLMGFVVFLFRSATRVFDRGNTVVPKTFLICAAPKIGDMVCSTPLFREVKRFFPDSRIIVVCHPRTPEILELNPHIDSIINFGNPTYTGMLGKFKMLEHIKNEKPNVFIQVNPDLDWLDLLTFIADIPVRIFTTSKFQNLTSKIINLFATKKKEYIQGELRIRHSLELLRFLGVKGEFNFQKEVFYGDDENNKAINFLKRNNIQDDFLVGMSITGGNEWKNWGVDKFAELSDKLTERGSRIVIIGSRSEKDKTELAKFSALVKNKPIAINEYFNLRELPALISKLKIFVSMDTGPFYIAETLGVPAVNITGPFDIREQIILHDKIEVVKDEKSCPPVMHLFPTSVPRPECKECFAATTVDMALSAINRLIARVYGR